MRWVSFFIIARVWATRRTVFASLSASLIGIGLGIGLCSTVLIGCASPKTSREIMEEKNSKARPRNSSYGSDNFYIEGRSPADRETRSWDFYYKHCNLIGRTNTPPNKADWECSDPK